MERDVSPGGSFAFVGCNVTTSSETPVCSSQDQLRLTALRLGQLQEKKDAQTHLIAKEIAALLSEDNVGLARAKAHNLFQEDIMGDLIEVLGQYVGILLEHFGELEAR